MGSALLFWRRGREAEVLETPPRTCRRRQKENQVELLERVNQATLQMLNKGGMAGTSVAGTGRKITDLVAYKSISDMQHNNTLSVQVGAAWALIDSRGQQQQVCLGLPP